MRTKTALAAALVLLIVGGVVAGLAYGKAGELPALRELVGRSARGRPIYAYLLGPPGGRSVLGVGSTHGDESAGMAIVSALRQLEPPVGVDLWLIPTINLRWSGRRHDGQRAR